MDPQIPRRILVVDDDDEFLLYARTVLTGEGYEVETAPSLPQARARLAGRRFAVVLADLRLPASNGLEVLQEARRSDPLTVGVVITGFSSVDSALKSLREGVFDYLVKPCSPDLLVAATRRALEHYELRCALVRKTAQLESAHHQLKDKERLFEDVSHELKNPLFVVYCYSDYLLNQKMPTSPEELRRTLLSIHNNAEQLGLLLDDLMEATRLSSGKIELDRRWLRAEAVCRDAFENHRLEANRRGIRLTADGPFPEETVEADPRRVQQILSNILRNALKFTPNGGAVSIGAALERDQMRFWVRDNGIGIPRHELSLLFERFYQAPEQKEKHQGLGLGLDIAKSLVRLHGGRIWAESAGEGKGAAFFFTLPLAARTTGPARAQELVAP